MSTPFTPVDKEPGEAERATPEQAEAALSVIQGVRGQLRQHGWWDTYDASGALAGRLFRERRRTGEALLYDGRGGRRVVPVRLADKEPVISAVVTGARQEQARTWEQERLRY